MAKIEKQELSEDEFIVRVKDLPAFQLLKKRVDVIVQQSSWWERHGVDNLHFIVGCALYAAGFVLLCRSLWQEVAFGILCMGTGHTILAAKVFHQATHGGMGESQLYNSLLCWVTGDFINCFPTEAGIDTHIKGHHPHTNIIGMGDSSIWKAPILPSWLYMFLAPVLLPVFTPLIGLQLIWKKPAHCLWFILSFCSGFYVCISILTTYGGYKWHGALAMLFMSRAVFSVSYIHINIFQHIGLPMYTPKSRPARLFQMSSGVLNLDRNPILDFAFGHSLINCHVEHHLFPRLSDNMCMKIKPVVQRFMEENDLPYHQDSYYNRFKTFLNDYTQLMVKAPPVWHYAGLQ